MLEVSGIEAFYGASQALFGVDLAVDEGAVVAQMARMVVVLPMPLRPISATTAPSSTARSTPNSAWLAP